MATPTEWLNEFQVNTGAAATGTQRDPKIVGLNNGHFVVAWVEASNGGLAGASPAGSDIIAKIFDAEGGVVRDSFRLNTFAAVDDEREVDLAAVHDGFVVTYVDDDISSPNTTGIIYERLDFNGTQSTSVGSSFQLAIEGIADDFLDNPQIAANLLPFEDDIFVAYEDDVGPNTNISARVVDTSGTLSAEFGAAQNSTDFDRLGDVAVLSNGNFVTVYEEDDSGTTSVEFSIRDNTGTAVVVARTVNSSGVEPSVTTLAGGGFVVAYRTVAEDVDFSVYDNSGNFVSNGSAAGGPNAQNEPVVVGLPDGGFVVAWDDDTADNLSAQRFNADGTPDGPPVILVNQGGTRIDIDVTGDGRILFTWRDVASAEIFASIWDPRPTTITLSDYDQQRANVLNSNIVTTGLNGSEVITGGATNSFTVLGQGGDDTINSTGTGEFRGGGGNDTIFAGLGASETLDGGDGIDLLDTTSWQFGYEINLETGNTNFSESFINFENLTTGDGDDTITGSGLGNIIRTGMGNDSVNATGGADEIHLGGGDDTATSSGLDTIFGEGGNDLIFAGLGTPESLDGGIGGRDTLDVTNWDFFYEINLTTGVTNFFGESFTNFENIVSGIGENNLTGTSIANNMRAGAGDDEVFGLAGNDTLSGDEGNDTLDGGGGIDSLLGGLGDDLFIVDNPNDIVREFGGEGSDTVESSASYNLNAVTQAVEVLRLTGNAHINATGNTINNTINGNSGNNSIVGAAGNDTMDGNAGADTLVGGTGNDSIIGGAGQDSMSGGNGNDIYRVDNPLDVVREFSGAGTGIDTVFASISYNLNQQSQSIEALTLTGSSFEAIGNSIANTLVGNSVNNRLVGAAGNDTLIGNAGNDTLLGGANNDQLTGGTGIDRSLGGFGNDTYFVDDFNDRVVEFLGEGIDAVFSTATFSLLFNSNNIENLTLQGVGNIDGSGNNASNTITGNNGDNALNGAAGFDILIGNAGNDTLNGGAGEDRLEGGTGNDVMNGGFDAQEDTFVFENNFGNDVIQNYGLNEDVIDLSGVTNITSFIDLNNNHLTQDGFNAVITDGINTITILNRDEAFFTANDFNFV